jgi:hypothetical protein
MSNQIFNTSKRVASSKLFWVGSALLCLVISFPFLNAQYGNSQVGIPTWEVDPEFKNDVFTFARVQYSSYGGRGGRGGRGGGRRGGGSWATDYPDAELNLAFRLQQMTSMKVSPEPVVITLDREDLQEFPFLYIVEPGNLSFQDTEVTALREYLLNGGFVMFDDFWGENEWQNVYYEIKRVFPDRELIDLPIEHPIFHIVFDLNEKPQVPSINHAVGNRGSGITWERSDAKFVHYRGIFDDKGRLMVLICQNTDLGDGWEREGESEWYFREFAEKKAYPMGINIIFYVMTH